eukprot:6866823-Prymnesium_polylepis.1
MATARASTCHRGNGEQLSVGLFNRCSGKWKRAGEVAQMSGSHPYPRLRSDVVVQMKHRLCERRVHWSQREGLDAMAELSEVHDIPVQRALLKGMLQARRARLQMPPNP